MFRIFDTATRRAKKVAEAFVRGRYPAYTLGRSVFRAQEGTKYIIAIFFSEQGVHDVPGRYLLITIVDDTGECTEIPNPLESPHAIRGLK